MDTAPSPALCQLPMAAFEGELSIPLAEDGLLPLFVAANDDLNFGAVYDRPYSYGGAEDDHGERFCTL